MDLFNLFLENPCICTDTRQIKKGDIFFALKGQNFNGNLFALQALSEGASLAVVDEEILSDDSSKIMKVDNVLAALQDLATKYRQFLNIPVFAITGSNGKTTTKELLAAVLDKKFKLNYTKGNLNNEIGVPLTILNTSVDDEFLLIEMGANHQGEIAALCQIALPDFGLITNIGKAHLEGFGGFEGVKKGKSELYRFLSENKKTIFINDNDTTLKTMLPLSGIFHHYDENNFEITQIAPYLELKFNKTKDIVTHLAGTYNLSNIAAAFAVGSYFGISESYIFDAISSYKPVNNRSQLSEMGGVKIIKDAYNANPSSVRASLNSFLSDENKDKVVILGDMLELGIYSSEEHLGILEYLTPKDTFENIFIGRQFYEFKDKFKGSFFLNVEEAKTSFDIEKYRYKTILLKGSRGIALEKLLS